MLRVRRKVKQEFYVAASALAFQIGATGGGRRTEVLFSVCVG